MAIGWQDILIPYLGFLCFSIFIMVFIIGMFVTMVWDLSRTKLPCNHIGTDAKMTEQRPSSEWVPGSPAERGLADLSPESAPDEMRAEYDFRTMRGVVRGKYAARYREKLRVVRLADDVAGAFEDEAAVNEALREYLRNRRKEGSSVP